MSEFTDVIAENAGPIKIISGPQGEQGIRGKDGEPGKSAFQSAVEGGYAGTEEEFYNALANSGKTEINVPMFNLGTLGLTPISIFGGGGVLETDTTDIVAAFEKGPVAFIVPVDVGGQTANATIVMNPASAMGSYQSIALINFMELATVTINVGEGMLRVIIEPLALEQEEEGAVSSTVDLTDFETDGIITETFASGEENIYTFEFDADGKPTRITDSKGNETALTW